jgi:hypothetical protein
MTAGPIDCQPFGPPGSHHHTTRDSIVAHFTDSGRNASVGMGGSDSYLFVGKYHRSYIFIIPYFRIRHS